MAQVWMFILMAKNFLFYYYYLVLSDIQISVPPSNLGPIVNKKILPLLKQLLSLKPQGKSLLGKSNRQSEQLSALVKVAKNYCGASTHTSMIIMPTVRTQLLAIAEPDFSWLTLSLYDTVNRYILKGSNSATLVVVHPNLKERICSPWSKFPPSEQHPS